MADSIIDYSRQTAYSDPGTWSHLFAGVDPTIEGASAAARNVIVHYRASGRVLPESSCQDISLRWLDAILETDQRRHPAPLNVDRTPESRVQGCCRDHSLLAIGVLRHHGVPARSRVGFTSYFSPTWHHDHVIVEAWIGGRWRRFDPEVAAPLAALPDPTDIPHGPDAPFLTAAQVWSGHRAGTLDVTRFGVTEGLGIDGDWFVHGYVIREVAHRFGDELLLWDEWGAMHESLSGAPDSDITLIDEVAGLLLRADGGDLVAERELRARYQSDDRLHPGNRIQTWPPTGGGRYGVDLSMRTETEQAKRGPLVG